MGVSGLPSGRVAEQDEYFARPWLGTIESAANFVTGARRGQTAGSGNLADDPQIDPYARNNHAQPTDGQGLARQSGEAEGSGLCPRPSPGQAFGIPNVKGMGSKGSALGGVQPEAEPLEGFGVKPRALAPRACRASRRAVKPRPRAWNGRDHPACGRGRGGTGRHARFRFWWRKPWGFKSLRPHHWQPCPMAGAKTGLNDAGH
jgi:hypothetical protein